eukprot:scaffold2991_cov403-Prasinococcus_capsulatus_cf.AAC.11
MGEARPTGVGGATCARERGARREGGGRETCRPGAGLARAREGWPRTCTRTPLRPAHPWARIPLRARGARRQRGRATQLARCAATRPLTVRLVRAPPDARLENMPDLEVLRTPEGRRRGKAILRHPPSAP